MASGSACSGTEHALHDRMFPLTCRREKRYSCCLDSKLSQLKQTLASSCNNIQRTTNPNSASPHEFCMNWQYLKISSVQRDHRGCCLHAIVKESSPVYFNQLAEQISKLFFEIFTFSSNFTATKGMKTLQQSLQFGWDNY